MSYTTDVAQKERSITVRIEDDLAQGMAVLRERHGTPLSEQIRRALRMWLASQGVIKAERKRAVTRKRP
jgi:Arc/MetJ-type ribon-helix-helix transcriptional regulator